MLFLKERIIILCQDILFTGFGPGDNSIKPFECKNYRFVSTAKKITSNFHTNSANNDYLAVNYGEKRCMK